MEKIGSSVEYAKRTSNSMEKIGSFVEISETNFKFHGKDLIFCGKKAKETYLRCRKADDFDGKRKGLELTEA